MREEEEMVATMVEEGEVDKHLVVLHKQLLHHEQRRQCRLGAFWIASLLLF